MIRGFRLPTRLVELVSRLYPRSCRDELVDDLVAAYDREHERTLRTRGRRAALLLWSRTVGGILLDAMRERCLGRDPVRPNRGSGRPPTGPLRHVVRDVRLSIRLWRRAPAHALVAVTSLALAVGVNVAVLDLLGTLFFDAPAVDDPGSVVTVMGSRDGESLVSGILFSIQDVSDLREASRTLEEIAVERPLWALVSDPAGSRELRGAAVSANYFSLLGVEPARGRFFRPEEDKVPGRDAVAVISHELWQRHFGATEDVVGREVTLNGRRFTIVGVGPPDFSGLFVTEKHHLWVPSVTGVTDEPAARLLDREERVFDLVARVAPGRSLEAVAGEVGGLTSRLLAASPGVDGAEASVQALVLPIGGAYPGTRERVGWTLALGLGIAGGLLLATCLNLAGLLLARNTARRREFALRRALGASRGTLGIQLLVESLVLAAGTGALAVPGALLGQDLVESWYAYWLPGLDLRFDPSALLAVFAVTLGATVGLGALPAWRGSRVDIVGDLKGTGGSVPGRGSPGSASGDALESRGQRAFVVAQIALSLMLLSGAAVMSSSMTAILGAGGSDPESVLHYRLRPGRAGYDAARARAWQDQVLRRVSRLPGVRSAALAEVGPSRGWCCPIAVSAPGRGGSGPEARLLVDNNAVTPGFLDTLGIPLLRGRGFRDSDDAGARRVAIVNEALARRLWPTGEALGGILEADGETHELIGIVANTHASRPREGPIPYVYFAYRQRDLVGARLYVRVDGPTAPLLQTVRREVAALDPDVHIGQEGTLAERIALAYPAERVLLGLLRASAVMALLLGALGLYGQLSLSVGRRRRDIGIRLALGATSRHVLSGEILRGLRLVTGGLALGFLGTWAQGRLLEAYVHGVDAREPALLLGAAALLLCVAVAAAWLPARRAARQDPMEPLRTA